MEAPERRDRSTYGRRREGRAHAREPREADDCARNCAADQIRRDDQEALGREPDRPQRYEGIEKLPRRVKVLPADAQAVKNYITEIARDKAC